MDFLDSAFLCATLKVDSARSTCRIAMVDSAFERVQPGIYAVSLTQIHIKRSV